MNYVYPPPAQYAQHQAAVAVQRERDHLVEETKLGELHRGAQAIAVAKAKRDAALRAYQNDPTPENWAAIIEAKDEALRVEKEVRARINILELCRMQARGGDRMQENTEQHAPLAAEPSEDVEALAAEAQAKIDAAAEALAKAERSAVEAQAKFENSPAAKTHTDAAVAEQVRVNAVKALEAAQAAAEPIFAKRTEARLTREALELVVALRSNPVAAVTAELEVAARAWLTALERFGELPALVAEYNSKVDILERRRQQLPNVELDWFQPINLGPAQSAINERLAAVGTSVKVVGGLVSAETKARNQ